MRPANRVTAHNFPPYRILYAISSTLKMGAVCTAETLVPTSKTMRCHNPVDHNINASRILIANLLTSSVINNFKVRLKKPGYLTRYSDGLRAGRPGIDSLWARDFSLVQSLRTDSGAQPASYPMGTGGSFPGGKAAGACSWPLTSI
jgi:hypothetical protein